MKTKNGRLSRARAAGRARLLVGGVLLALSLGACSSGGGASGFGEEAGVVHGEQNRASARRRAMVSDQGRSWETVFATPSARAYGADDQSGWEVARNDYQIAGRTDTYISAATDWPEAERPRLDRARRLTLPRDANQIIYYRTESEYRSTRDGWGGGGGGWWY